MWIKLTGTCTVRNGNQINFAQAHKPKRDNKWLKIKLFFAINAMEGAPYMRIIQFRSRDNFAFQKPPDPAYSRKTNIALKTHEFCRQECKCHVLSTFAPTASTDVTIYKRIHCLQLTQSKPASCPICEQIAGPFYPAKKPWPSNIYCRKKLACAFAG